MTSKIEVVSEAAAVISAAAAYFSYRAAASANKIARRADMPVLRGEYNVREDRLLITNYGHGPALNLQLQRNTVHYTDIKKMYEFAIRGKTYPSIMPGETRPIQISAYDASGKGTSENATIWMMASAAGKGKVIFIYFDIHDKSHEVVFRCYETSNGYALDFVEARKYGRLSWIKDFVESFAYRLDLLKKFRERKEK